MYYIVGIRDENISVLDTRDNTVDTVTLQDIDTLFKRGIKIRGIHKDGRLFIRYPEFVRYDLKQGVEEYFAISEITVMDSGIIGYSGYYINNTFERLYQIAVDGCVRLPHIDSVNYSLNDMSRVADKFAGWYWSVVSCDSTDELKRQGVVCRYNRWLRVVIDKERTFNLDILADNTYLVGSYLYQNFDLWGKVLKQVYQDGYIAKF